VGYITCYCTPAVHLAFYLPVHRLLSWKILIDRNIKGFLTFFSAARLSPWLDLSGFVGSKDNKTNYIPPSHVAGLLFWMWPGTETCLQYSVNHLEMELVVLENNVEWNGHIWWRDYLIAWCRWAEFKQISMRRTNLPLAEWLRKEWNPAVCMIKWSEGLLFSSRGEIFRGKERNPRPVEE
jgi:hypothetical protein